MYSHQPAPFPSLRFCVVAFRRLAFHPTPPHLMLAFRVSPPITACILTDVGRWDVVQTFLAWRELLLNEGVELSIIRYSLFGGCLAREVYFRLSFG
ncbi:hypothetical protein M758_4G166500, partial [Ceratodon purpureus]